MIRYAKMLVVPMAVLMTLAVVILPSPPARAVAPSPELIEELRATGRWEGYLDMRRDAAARGVCAPSPVKKPSQRWAAGTATDYRLLCILVDFSDNPAAGGSIAATPAMFDSLLFSSGPVNPTGSFKDYFDEVSYGQMNVIGTTVGWYRLANTYAYYMNGTSGIGTYPQNSQGLVEAAIDAAEAGGVDFAPFDNDGDGVVEGVMVIVPGLGAEETGDTAQIHSHKFNLPVARVYDGKVISDYTIQPEESAGWLNTIGVFVHEWGHILGLPDLYDLDDCDSLAVCGGDLSWGLGDWSLMAVGNWLGNGERPAHLDAWCRIQAGFVTPTNITTNQTGVTIPAVETSPTIFRLWTSGLAGSEYYLVENRRRTGFDAALPGQGLLVYHVDETVANNVSEWIEGFDPPTPHYKIALEQADGVFALEKWLNSGDDGDPFAGDSAGFDQISYPSTRAYSGAATQVAVWNISPSASSMTANFDVTFSRPFLQTSNHTIADPLGDGDGVPEPGETFQITFDLTNQMLAANNIDVTVTAPGSDLIMVDNTFHLTSLGSLATTNNLSDPITITLPGNYRSRMESFTLTITAEGGAYQWVESLSLAIGPPHFLVVDDDGGGTRDVKLRATLDLLNETYRHWDVSTLGTPAGDTLLNYPIVFWMTGDSNTTRPTAAGVTAMQSYLDGNGHLFLTGQDIAENIAGRADAAFLGDYLGVQYDGELLELLVLKGVATDPISDGLMPAIFGSDGANNQSSWPDHIALSPGSPASICYTFFQTGQGAGAHIERNYRAAFFAFGFEAIPSTQFGFSTRADVLQPIISWLDGDLTTGILDDEDDQAVSAGRPESFVLSQNYPNPFNAGTLIPFTLTEAGVRNVRVEVFDILGRRIRVLMDEDLEPGQYSVAWDGTDENGNSLASGVYLYRLSIPGQSQWARQMVLLK